MMKMAQISQNVCRIPPPPEEFEEAEDFDDDYGEDFGEIEFSSVNRSMETPESINIYHCKTCKGAGVQVNLIPPPVLMNIKEYLVCDDCGRCYWDGSHFNRFIDAKLKNIIEKS